MSVWLLSISSSASLLTTLDSQTSVTPADLIPASHSLPLIPVVLDSIITGVEFSGED